MSEIQANHNPLIDNKEITFNFRKTKDEETGVESKRAAVTLNLGIPSVEGIVQILEAGGKQLDLLRSAVETVITDYVKSVLGDDTSLTSDNFPIDSVTWEAIANQPDSERRGRGIPKEVWEDFIKSYMQIMPGLLGKTEDVIKRQAVILAAKFQPLRNHEKKLELLPKFVEMLALYVSNAPDAEQFTGPVEFLLKKAEDMMKQDSAADLAENLGF